MSQRGLLLHGAHRQVHARLHSRSRRRRGHDFLLLGIGSHNIYLKALVYSWTAWFLLFSVTLLFRLPHLTIIGFDTSVSKFVAVGLYGLTTAAVLSRLDGPARRRP